MQADAILIPVDVYDKKYIAHTYWSERDQRYEMIQIDARAVGVVGALVLFNDYHEDQLWLSFASFVLAKAPPTKEERARDQEERERKLFLRERNREWRRRIAEQGDGDDDEHDCWGYANSYERDRAREETRRKLEAPMYVRDTEFYRLHDRQQALLPFIEIQECGEHEFYAVRDTWEREGKPPKPILFGQKRRRSHRDDDRSWLELTIPLSQDETRAWLLANIPGRFHFQKKKPTVVFERYPDWLFARLRFSGGDQE